MPLLETIFTIYKTTSTAASGIRTVIKYFRSEVDVEKVLTTLVEKAFSQHQQKVKHLFSVADPEFQAKVFEKSLKEKNIDATTREELEIALLPLLEEAVLTPSFNPNSSELTAFYQMVIRESLKDMWKEFSKLDEGKIANEVQLSQGSDLINKATKLNKDVEVIDNKIDELSSNIDEVKFIIKEFIGFSQSSWQLYFERTTETAPPLKHIVENQEYINPFLLGRAEDFNHNYDLLAHLFYGSPEWKSIQSKTDNVFIEGGRGTGKSMLLRRLTAQATVAAKRRETEKATFEDANQDYFGVYVKLTRGYYDQFLSMDTVQSQIGSLIAQHELNIEIFDAFVDTLNWLEDENALPINRKELPKLINELNDLFPEAPKVSELHELQSKVFHFEQQQIISYYRNRAFDIDKQYAGSAQDTVSFLRSLSRIFREYLSANQKLRLFLLIDEFETLLTIQQIAINTVIKMRLNDLSVKIAVRKSGRKTSDTFTANDPIQDPRDYINVSLNYKVNDASYAKLLKGIANKRLEGAGYKDIDIDSYLLPVTDEIENEEIEKELELMWESGNRKNEFINSNFKQTYKVAATYRALNKKHRTKSFGGFEDYQLLSSGVISNFIELCKYTFYFALEEEHKLNDVPGIPVDLQTASVYKVSKRLFHTIEGNVPKVGVVLTNLLNDLAEILRSRLLSHTSEPEANRFEITNYDDISNEKFSLIKKVLEEAIIWSVFHEFIPTEAMRPKNYENPSGTELIINRIYCPALGISPRTRWRITLQLENLNALVNSSQRKSTYKKLMGKFGANDNKEQLKLFQ